jgi:hypothetical protein
MKMLGRSPTAHVPHRPHVCEVRAGTGTLTGFALLKHGRPDAADREIDRQRGANWPCADNHDIRFTCHP